MTRSTINDEAPLDLRLSIGRLSMDPHQIIYGTIMLMTAYALYDEGHDPLGGGPLLAIIGVSIAPLFALAMAHAFSEALDFQIRHSRRLTWADRWTVLGGNLLYLLLAVPPAIVMIILTLFGWNANQVVTVVQILGLATLAFWGAFAARKAGLGVPRQITIAQSYGVMGVIVIAVELIITH